MHQEFRGHFDNPVTTLLVDTDESSDYAQLLLKDGQAVILNSVQVSEIIQQLTGWLASRVGRLL